jgi:hypothetical protein
MANAWDASIKLVYAADKGTTFTIDVLEPGDAFDVVADVEIGEDLNEFVSQHTLRASVVNLTTAAQVAFKEVTLPLVPENNKQRREQIVAPIGAIAGLNSGDVLQVVASYKVIAGVNVRLSSATSDTFQAA